MNLKYILLILITLPFMTFSQNHESYTSLENVDQLKEGITKMAEQTNTIKTSFKQEKHISILTKAVSSEGDMVFKKPNSLKWTYSKPYKYKIIFKKEEIIINDEGKVSKFDLSSSKSFIEINEIIVNSVSGNILQENQFSIDYFQNGNYYLAKMIPKVEQLRSYIETIEIYFNKNDFTVASIKLIEKEKDYTIINFFDNKLNEEISDEAFNAN